MVSIKKKLNIAKNFMNGSLKVCEFGLTNCCTCKCSFCGIWRQEKKVMVDFDKAKRAIDILHKAGVSHITLTGGEPLLHPRIVDIVKYCTKKNIHTSVLNADARIPTEEKIKQLKEAGLDMISISIDSHDPKIVEASRKIPGLLGHIEKLVHIAKKHDLQTMASIVIWKGNHEHLKELFDKINEIGFDLTSINYPEVSESKVYPLGGDGVLNLSKKDIIVALKKIMELKKTGKYNIINMDSSMENIIKYLEDPKTVKYYCFGGHRVFFLDWFFNLYPCMHLPEPIGNIFELDLKQLKKIKCNSCNMSWYRDFSVFFHGTKSIYPVVELIGSSVKLGV
jgi:MoaA/NifB/PqqE/SkfB family radical SAM enzyme